MRDRISIRVKEPQDCSMPPVVTVQYCTSLHFATACLWLILGTEYSRVHIVPLVLSYNQHLQPLRHPRTSVDHLGRDLREWKWKILKPTRILKDQLDLPGKTGE
ncbi:hypothetical protein L211DRAFT_724470 [Terfezia boudieri ATCC MYA-4762]|uniref:Uncharacterized protein n=1 Tax=Terfezia boudieri ATCC MYA-4762 TaxID=1051890 RepID=A0A3N4LAM4_9PEZI|nr:hypothetical protein L211DRAFT_724470 [Terfezia boudieri ATCC MYA-4762]